MTLGRLDHLHFVQSFEVLQGGGLASASLQLHESLLEIGCPSSIVGTVQGAGFKSVIPNVYSVQNCWNTPFYIGKNESSIADHLPYSPELVHSHGLYTYQNYFWGKYARQRKIPLVYHPHGMFEPYILSRSRWKKRLVGLLFENRNMKSVAAWRVLTAKEGEQVRALGFNQPLIELPNGIDLENIDVCLSALQPSEARPRKKLIYLARLHPKKGLEVLLRALAACGDQRLELDIYGPDEGAYQSKLERVVSELGLSAKVRFLGSVSGEQKYQAIHDADVFALPSFSEGFPMGILEGMACRKPVLMTPYCNFSPDDTKDVGWVLEPTVEALTGALCEIGEATTGELKSMGQAGRALVERKYQWSEIAGALDKELSALV